MDNSRLCQYQGHTTIYCSYICTFKDCNLRRWVCSECFRQQLHQHEQKTLSHIMNQKQFREYLNHQINPIKHSVLKQQQFAYHLIGQLNETIKILKALIEQLQQDINNTWRFYDMPNIIELCNYVKNDFYSLEWDQISKVHNLEPKDNQIDYREIQRITYLLNSQVGELSQFVVQRNNGEVITIKKQEESIKKSLIKFFNGFPRMLGKMQHNYQVERIYGRGNLPQYNDQPQLELPQMEQKYRLYIDYHQKNIINTSAISQDDRMLAISNFNQIQIYYLGQKSNNFNVQLEKEAYICKFSNDSQKLFCADVEGNLYCFEVSTFKLLYQLKIHKNLINNLIIINEKSVLTSSLDQTILITKTKSKRGKLLIENTDCMGLDHNKHYNTICFTNTNSFNFYDAENAQLIFKRDYKDGDAICQIQFMQTNKLISRSQIRFFLWQVDYDDKWMAKIKCFKYNNGILNIFSCLNDTRILIVDTIHCEIYDDKLNFVQRIELNNKFAYCNNTSHINR